MTMNNTTITHTALCFDIKSLAHSILEHFDLLVEHKKNNKEERFVSNVYIPKWLYEEVGIEDLIDYYRAVFYLYKKVLFGWSHSNYFSRDSYDAVSCFKVDMKNKKDALMRLIIKDYYKKDE